MIYQWKAGAVVKASAEDAGAQCEALSRAGKLTPAALVDLNRPEDAPLHNAFEWRDDVAAEKYRESQARYLITNLACVVDEMPKQPVRAFVKATAERRHYTPYRIAMQSPDMRAYLLGQARAELSAFTNKYRNLQELARVVQVMDEFLEPGRQRQTDAERSLSAAQ